MDILRHLLFCPPGTPFFDRTGTGAPAGDDFAAATGEPPRGWRLDLGPDWAMLTPPEPNLPVQGWKIHVSATPDNAERLLATTLEYAVPRRIAFKFIRGRQVLLRRNGKYGDRSASGKFITVYPRDEAQFALVLDELGDLLDGEAGPYILSDLRWRSGPLYVRYGGFAALTRRTESGEVEHCIVDPQGRLVPDRRGPSFRPPEWVRLPDCLAEAVRARNAGTLTGFPYQVEKALHFSNGGGVYRGTDRRTGEAVLLREARPLAGLDSRGKDAVARLQAEHRVLRQLAGLPHIPRLIDCRVGHEHHFLVREYVEGEPLAVAATRRTPLPEEPGGADTAEYTRWALEVLDRIEHGLEAMHDRGVVFGDLHPGNILLRPDGQVVFIDLETATTDPEAEQIHAAPGFAAPDTYRGRAVDRYALGCLRLALFAPRTTLLGWGPHKTEQLIDFVTARFPVPEDFAARVRQDLGPAAVPEDRAEDGPDALLHEPPAGPLLRAVADGIAVTATPERADRLFPGDAAQFFSPEGGVSLAHGAAGVLWALAETGQDVPAEHADWLETAARGLTDPAPGLYTGVAGLACALDRLGRHGTAHDLLDQLRKGTDHVPNDSLFDGHAGVGLAFLDIARRTGDRADLDHALAAADRIVRRAADRPPHPGRAGLMRGPAGGALLLLRLHRETSEAGYLDAAERLLEDDLRALGWTDGEGWAAGAPGGRPLLAAGGAGTALVLHEFLAHRPQPRFARARDAVLAAARRDVPRTAGLFHGWAGTVLALRHLGESPAQGALRRLHGELPLFAVRHRQQPAFLGHENLRLSADLATGAAGVLLALHASTADGRPGLPLF